MRHFLAGVAVGAVAGAGFYAWLSSGAPVEKPKPTPEGLAPAASAPPVVKTETVIVSVPAPAPAPVPVPTSPPPPAATTPASPPREPVQESAEMAPAAPLPPVPPSVSQLRERFSGEERDEPWSSGAEDRLRGYLAPLAAQHDIEIALIACRTTLCEVQVSGAADHADQRWGEIVRGIHGQPWGRDFSNISSQSQTDHGRAAILTMLQRQAR